MGSFPSQGKIPHSPLGARGSDLSATTAGLLLHVYPRGQTKAAVLTPVSGRSSRAPQPRPQKVLVALVLNSESELIVAAGLWGLVMGGQILRMYVSWGGLFNFFHFQHAWELGETRWAQSAKQDEKRMALSCPTPLENTEGEGEALRGEKTAEDKRCREII